MKPRLIKSDGIDIKYVHWARRTLLPFGPIVTDNVGRRFELKRPIDTVLILREVEFDQTESAFRQIQKFLGAKIEMNLEISRAPPDEIDPSDPMSTPGAFWFPPIPETDFKSVEPMMRQLPGIVKAGFDHDRSVVFLCPERISRLASRISGELHELVGRDILPWVFKIVLAHEIGHHYSFGNLESEQYLRITHEENGRFILEGLANWFVYQLCSKEERWVLAEMTLVQPIAYRYYHVLRFADTMNLLGRLLQDPRPSIGNLGGKIFFKVPLCARRINGFQNMMDWDGNGAKILAIEYMEAIGPMLKGCLVAPKIKFLIGRFPKDFLIVTNAIENILDYGELPANILILPKEEKDIESIAKSNLDKTSDELVKSVLVDIGVDVNWMLRLFPPDLRTRM